MVLLQMCRALDQRLIMHIGSEFAVISQQCSLTLAYLLSVRLYLASTLLMKVPSHQNLGNTVCLLLNKLRLGGSWTNILQRGGLDRVLVLMAPQCCLHAIRTTHFVCALTIEQSTSEPSRIGILYLELMTCSTNCPLHVCFPKST